MGKDEYPEGHPDKRYDDKCLHGVLLSSCIYIANIRIFRETAKGKSLFLHRELRKRKVFQSDFLKLLVNSRLCLLHGIHLVMVFLVEIANVLALVLLFVRANLQIARNEHTHL